MSNFKVVKRDVGERWHQYSVSRYDKTIGWYGIAHFNQEEHIAEFVCKLLNDHEEELLAFEEEYYEDG